MTPETKSVQENTEVKQEKSNDKELNFRALETKHRMEIQKERERVEAMQREMQELKSMLNRNSDVEEVDDDPYVDQRKLNKKLEQFGKKSQEQTQSQIQTAINKAIQEDRRDRWLDQNKDFYEVLNHANKLYETDPELAETILQMPESFERQKLVYKNIKALGLHKDKPKEPSMQEQIDAKRRGPYYQPTGEASSPYGRSGDFSNQGKKSAYDYMKQLQNNMRL